MLTFDFESLSTWVHVTLIPCSYQSVFTDFIPSSFRSSPTYFWANVYTPMHNSYWGSTITSRMPFPFPTRSQARFLSWTMPLPISSTWRRPNSSFRQGSSRWKMKFLIFTIAKDNLRCVKPLASSTRGTLMACVPHTVIVSALDVFILVGDPTCYAQCCYVYAISTLSVLCVWPSDFQHCHTLNTCHPHSLQVSIKVRLFIFEPASCDPNIWPLHKPNIDLAFASSMLSCPPGCCIFLYHYASAHTADSSYRSALPSLHLSAQRGMRCLWPRPIRM